MFMKNGYQINKLLLMFQKFVVYLQVLVQMYILYIYIQYASHSNHFVENHDEVRAVVKFSNKDYIAAVAALMSYTIPGARFINHG